LVSICRRSHTLDTSVLVKATFQNLGTAEIQWSLTKDGKAVSVADCIEGTLTETNSTVRFKEKGEYVLKAALPTLQAELQLYRTHQGLSGTQHHLQAAANRPHRYCCFCEFQKPWN
jgi:hypothetical protein